MGALWDLADRYADVVSRSETLAVVGRVAPSIQGRSELAAQM
jgi:hypothetical protein